MLNIRPLDRLLVEKGMNIAILSQVSGISTHTFELMKKGRCITKANIETICKVLDCQPSDVIEFTMSETKGHWVYVEEK